MTTNRILKTWSWIMLTVLLSAGSLTAGNLRIADEVRVVGVENDFFTLSLSLSWDNSWYDDYNFDAVWLFIKYRTADATEWTPLFLSPGGHDTGTNGAWLPGESGSENVGLFVWTKMPVNGKAELNCRVRCAIPYGLTRGDVEQNKMYFAVQGVEMAYVPAGAYALGDGAAQATFCKTGSSQPLLVEAETALTFADTEGNTYDLGADYPKGYNGFFCMKTEISQKQYVDFLNLLALPQQYERIAALYPMAEGSYVFNGAATPAARNGIKLKKKSTDSSVPCIFSNDLNNNGTANEGDDGQAVACNYLSPEDVYAYCAWAGLRPMSEMEFEKACRKQFPERVSAGEYPWNTNAGALAVSEAGLSGKNTAAEKATGGKNVNAGGGFAAPVRGGAFAGNTAIQAGATCWGIFGMAGNLRECCISAAADYFTADCGDGSLDKGDQWTGTVTRGGGFNSPLARLQSSDRDGMTNMTDETAHEADLGGRACRSVSAGTAGTITCLDHTTTGKVCMGAKGQVISGSLPGDSQGVTYRWVVRADGSELWTPLSGETGNSLEYEPDTRVPGASRFYFRRIAHSRMGDLLSNVVELTFINNDLQLSCARDTVDKCGEADVIEASHHDVGTIRWKVGERVLLSEDRIGGTGFLPDRSLGAANAETLLTCQSVIGGCTQTIDIPVYIRPEAADPATECWTCSDNVTDVEGNSYRTVPTPDGRCWMQDNMRIDVPDSYLYTGAEMQRFGRLYTWNAAMAGKDYEGARGVCPEGWCLPTKSEWTALIDALGGRNNAGTTLRDAPLYLILGGNRNAGTNNFVGMDVRGDYWSASLKDDVSALGITINKDDAVVNDYEAGIQNAVSVRCIKKIK